MITVLTSITSSGFSRTAEIGGLGAWGRKIFADHALQTLANALHLHSFVELFNLNNFYNSKRSRNSFSICLKSSSALYPALKMTAPLLLINIELVKRCFSAPHLPCLSHCFTEQSILPTVGWGGVGGTLHYCKMK